jgi:peptide deformylase
MKEGCLSFPGVALDISRSSAIRARYTLPNGDTQTSDYAGLTARVFQHEYDHLEGVLFTDHVSRAARELAYKKLKKIDWTHESFEQDVKPLAMRTTGPDGERWWS